MISPSWPLAPIALLVMLGAACGARREPTPATTTTPPSSDEPTPAPVTVAAPSTTSPCPDEESVLAALAPLERHVRETLNLPCVAGPGGYWALSLSELAVTVTEGTEETEREERTTGDLAFAFVEAASGRTLVGTSQPLGLVLGEGSYRSTQIEPRARFDIDGDGVPELFVWIGVIEYEATPRGEIHVFTAGRGAVTEYALAGVDVPIDDVEDVDGDGRPDLVSRTPYFGTSPWGASPVPAGGPQNVYRGRPDGTFSNQDPVVLARLHASCPAAPERFLASTPSEEGYERSLTAVSCARLHGVTPEEIARRVREERAAGTCTDEGWSECSPLVEALLAHARLTPLHHLR